MNEIIRFVSIQFNANDSMIDAVLDTVITMKDDIGQ